MARLELEMETRSLHDDIMSTGPALWRWRRSTGPPHPTIRPPKDQNIWDGLTTMNGQGWDVRLEHTVWTAVVSSSVGEERDAPVNAISV